MPAGPQVLVGDDDPQLREAQTRALEIEDYRVCTASNGVKALGPVGEDGPDVVVGDVWAALLRAFGAGRVVDDRDLAIARWAPAVDDVVRLVRDAIAEPQRHGSARG